MREGTDEAVKVGRGGTGKHVGSAVVDRGVPPQADKMVPRRGRTLVAKCDKEILLTGNTWSNNDALCQERG
mgnify:CR=1 FL=1